MEVSVTEAGAQLTELIRRAEAGDEVILTSDGRPAVRLTPVRPTSVRPTLTPEERAAVIERAVASARGKLTPGPDAARSQDFLYDEDGLPA